MTRRAFLPDFCAIPVVFSVVIIGQLLAFVLVLAGHDAGLTASWWGELALTSLFIQWVGLSSAAILCGLGRYLQRASDAVAAWVSLGTVVIVTGLATEAGQWMVNARWIVLDDGPVWGASSGLWFTHAGSDKAWLFARNLVIAAVVSALALRYFYVQAQWRRQLELESEARVQALQSRIRPHFLFNSMNTIASFTRSEPALAEQVVEDLAELFRVSLGDARVSTDLSRELELCQQYVRIEGLRLGERLVVEWQTDSLALASKGLLPALTLQPLIENAVYHGIEPAPEGGSIVVGGQVSRGRVEVTITNSKTPGASSRSGHHMALENVRERLGAYFGGEASVEVLDRPTLYSVTLRFPFRETGLS